MNNKLFKYLYDIKQSCELITEFSQGKNFADYQDNAMLRSAIERQLSIIGEALNQAIKIEPNIANEIIDSRTIVDFRNFLIHAYTSVSNEVVWGVVESKLPILYQEIKTLLPQD